MLRIEELKNLYLNEQILPIHRARPFVCYDKTKEFIVTTSIQDTTPSGATFVSPVHQVTLPSAIPLIAVFRKNIDTYIDDATQEYIDQLKNDRVCKFISSSSLSSLPEAMSQKPQCLLFYADGLFEENSSVSEFTMMLKTMIYFTSPDANVKIGFIMCQNTPHRFIKELQKAGVFGIVPDFKSWGAAETTKSLEALINGIPYWPKHLIEQLPGNIAKPKKDAVKLTGRQQEVLDLIANRGLSNKQIAKSLGISESTVKIHVSAIMKAYCVRNRTQLALMKK